MITRDIKDIWQIGTEQSTAAVNKSQWSSYHYFDRKTSSCGLSLMDTAISTSNLHACNAVVDLLTKNIQLKKNRC